MTRLNSRTGDQALLRDINQSLILNCLRESAPISRAGLSVLLGLNKTTVSNIVRTLIAQNLIHEIGSQSSGTGRPAIMVEINADAGCIIGAEIGLNFIAAIRANFVPNVQWHQRRELANTSDPDTVIKQLIVLLRQGIEDAKRANCRIFGVAIGVPGLVDRNSGQLLFAPNLGWTSVALGQRVADALDYPVHVDNEANMAILGELYFGVARGCKNVLYLSTGVGLGGGIIADGRLFTGNGGFAGEFGHISMDPNGRICNCGNHGCFETLVSQLALYDHIRQAVKAGQSSILSEAVSQNHFVFERIVEAAQAADQVCLQSFETLGTTLGRGIAGLVNTFDPELVVLGGSLSLASEFVLPAAQTELNQRMKPWKREIPTITPARYTFDACMIGGVAAIYDQIMHPHQQGR